MNHIKQNALFISNRSDETKITVSTANILNLTINRAPRVSPVLSIIWNLTVTINCILLILKIVSIKSQSNLDIESF